ncbi:MAG TPA: hypothetical protein C5S37_07430 [Methanophagales archaeon]|nr:hypothetical protein [Methanophagales archaeon]
MTETSYTNTSPTVGTWNVSAVATNENGTVSRMWIWNVSSTAPTPTPGPTPSPSPITTPSPAPAPIQSLESNITPSTPFFIYGYVSYKNGDKCNKPVVNITINANMSWQVETSNNSNYFQLVVTNINKEDVLEFNATDGVGYNTTNRAIVQEDINKGVIFDFNLTLPVLAPIINNITITDDDLTVPGVQVINPDPSTNKTVTITANVTDLSGEDIVNISVMANLTGPSTVEDSPVSLMFVSNSSATTAIYNGTFNMSNHSAGNYTVEVNATNAEGFSGVDSKNFTYLHGPDLIVKNISTPFYLIANESNMINATIRNNGTTTAIKFNISLSIANDTLDTVTVPSLNASDSKSVSFNWIPEQEGNYTLRVMADSEHEVSESNETNNNLTITVLVGVSDFSVHEMHMFINETEIDVNDTIWDSDTVRINTTILNNGTREGNCTVEFCDVKNISFERTYVKYENFSQRGTDVIVQLGAIEMRVHFEYIYVKGASSYLSVSGNNDSVNRSFKSTYYIDEWVNCSGDTIKLNSYASSAWNASILFKIDKYEAVLKKQTESLLPNKNSSLTANWTATTGNHMILVRAIPLVPDRDETNNQAETGEVYVSPSRDFKVANVSFYPTSPFVGDDVTSNATIENLGNRSGNVTVDFYLDDNFESFANRSVFVNANETTNGTSIASVVWENAEPGNHTITAIADPLNITWEIDETNNKNETTIFVDAFDFTITNITLNSDKYEFNFSERVEINATVENFNFGNKPGFANVSFYVNNTEKVGLINITTNVSVGVGVKSYLVVDWNTSSTGLAGTCMINVTVDPSNNIFELDERNNSMSKLIFVNGTDLTVLGIDVIPGEVYYDKEQMNVTLKANIANSGAIKASNFNVAFYNDSSLIGTNKSLNFGAGEKIQVICPETWNATFDTHEIKVVIEHGNNPENNVSNNERSKTVMIAPDVDFTVTNITFDPKEPKEGQNVTINATIENLGNRSGSVNVAFYLDYKTDTVYHSTVFYTSPKIFVDANGTNYTTAVWNATLDINLLEYIQKTGYCNITVVVDPDGEIFESNGDNNAENNNARNKTLNLTLSNLTIQEIDIDPPQPIVGNVSVTARIKNNDNERANSTVWLYEEKSKLPSYWMSPGNIISHPDARMIRIHFDSLLLKQLSSLEVFIDDQLLLSAPFEGMKEETVQGKKEYTKSDFWTDWGQGSNIRIEAVARDYYGFRIDKYQALLWNESISLGANDTCNFTIIWNATQGDHTLCVGTSSDTNRTDVFVSGTDLAVTGVDLPGVKQDNLGVYKLSINESVNINATISNFGLMNTSNFTVWFNDTLPSGEAKTINVTHNLTLKANHSRPINITWNATPPTGRHDITVEIDLRDNPENNRRNDVKPVKVDVLTPWDFAVTDISFDPEEPEEGEDVTIKARIENLGDINGSVDVSFYVDGIIVEKDKEVVDIIGASTIINITNVSVKVGKSKNVIVNWTAKPDIEHLTANHTITVWVDPYNEQYPDEVCEKNILNETIQIKENLKIDNVTLDINPAYDQLVNINATIKNNGSKDINATAWFYSEKVIDNLKKVTVSSIGVDAKERNDTITQPGVQMIRIHFADFYIPTGGFYIRIYDDKGKLVHDLSSENERLKIKDDDWTYWIPGNTTLITSYVPGYTSNKSLTFTIDRYQALIENKTTEIAHGNETQFTINWTASPTTYRTEEKFVGYSPTAEETKRIGNCTINVWVVNDTSITDVYINGTDLAVTNVSVKEEVLDGDLVNINATIINFGEHVAENFTVEFYDVLIDAAKEVFIGNMTIPSLKSGESNISSVPWNASLKVYAKDEGKYYTSYNHTIQVKVIPENTDLENDFGLGNNMNESRVVLRVNISRDFSICNVSFSHNRTRLVAGMNVALNATVNVTNLANQGGNVTIGFYLDGKRLPNSPRNASYRKGYGTGYAILDWHIVNFDGVKVPGDHNLTVVADPENKTIEFNESNNATIPIWIYARAADLTVTNISFEPKSPVKGDIVNITATVANLGKQNASNVNVSFIDKWKGDEYPIANRTISLNASELKNISVKNWTAFPAGEHLISVTIDLPEDHIIEHNESNNTLAKEVVVQGPDLVISDMQLTWLNGTEVAETENETIQLKHGEVIKINAEISNIGVLPANNFKTSFLMDSESIKPEPPTMSLACEGGGSKSRSVFAVWKAEVGNHIIKVEADPEDVIAETNESNNTREKEVYVCAPELSGVISWNPAEPVDTDEVIINATTKNNGCLPAQNFNVLMFYDYSSQNVYSHIDILTSPDVGWVNRSYPGAKWIYVQVIKECAHEWWESANIESGDITIYNGNNSKIAEPTVSCWIPVEGDTANVYVGIRKGQCVQIYLYAVYADNISKIERLEVGQTTIFSMRQKVSTGNHTVTVFIDPENNVPENKEEDNSPSDTRYVKPSRDFTVTNVTVEKTELSDTDTTNITANVSNIGFRNGTTELSFVDYKKGNRLYNYRFEWSISPPYLPMDPDVMTIHRPGVDAIQVHFDIDIVYESGYIKVWNEYKYLSWSKPGLMYNCSVTTDWIPGDTVYISADKADFKLGYTTKQEFKRIKGVTLNATETMNESKNITVEWTASTGEHTIAAIADPDNEIGEIDEERGESNNEFNTSVIHVNASRDPTIVELSSAPLYPEEGDNVEITAVVRNNGTKEANFTVDLWESTKKDFTINSAHNISVWGASWVSVHLKEITVGKPWDVPKEERNLWVGSIGDTLKVDHLHDEKFPIYHWWTVGGIPTCDSDWYKQIDRIEYKRLLKREHVSLAPNTETTVSATWYHVDFSDNAIHTVIAIVDAEDEIDELDERNNRIDLQIGEALPDLTVDDKIGYDEVTKNATVTIENIGHEDAENVTVCFAREEELEHPIVSKGGTSSRSISKQGADVIKAHVEYLYVDEDEGEYLYIGDKKYNKTDDNGFWSDWENTYEGSIGLWWKGARFTIDKYKYGIFLEENIDVIKAKEQENVSIPWSEYEAPYELMVEVDPEIDTTDDISGVIIELNEGNNEETFRMGADIEVKVKGNVYPYAPLTDYTENCSIKAIKNIGNLPTNEFEAKLEVTNVIGPSYSFDEQSPISSLAPGEEYNLFWPVPENLPDMRVYNITVIADIGNNTKELKENNNIGWDNITVYNYTNYGGKDLEPYGGRRTVYGGFAYTIGDSKYNESKTEKKYYEVHFNDVYPEGASPVFARLYLYWVWSYLCEDFNNKCCEPSPPLDPTSGPSDIDIDVKFNNGPSLGAPYKGGYYESPHASDFDVAWGAYAYPISSYVPRNNTVNITKKYPYCNYTDEMGINHTMYTFAIYGAGLLVAYNDSNGVLTDYWINEGADVLYATASELDVMDLFTTVIFNGSVENINLANATLWTVVPGGGSEDDTELRFNEGIWEDVWTYQAPSQIGIDNRTITDNLSTSNSAKIQLIGGGSMMPTNAFLIAQYPPDLVPCVKTPLAATVGQEYDVPVYINNIGLSNAKGFNASVYVEEVLENTINDIEIAGGDHNDELTFTRKAPLTEGVISFNVTVVVDPEDNVKELIRKGHDGEANNNQTWPVIVSVGAPDWEPGPGRGGGGKGTGWGPGIGPGEGIGASGVTAGGTGEAAVGEFTGEAITGYLMKGRVASSGASGGGGGRGEFSLVALLLRLAMLAAAGALVCVGYLLERRRHKHKQ